jgi:hypothetical protein
MKQQISINLEMADDFVFDWDSFIQNVLKAVPNNVTISIEGINKVDEKK